MRSTLLGIAMRSNSGAGWKICHLWILDAFAASHEPDRIGSTIDIYQEMPPKAHQHTSLPNEPGDAFWHISFNRQRLIDDLTNAIKKRTQH
jgi:hypothetical protein